MTILFLLLLVCLLLALVCLAARRINRSETTNMINEASCLSAGVKRRE